MRHGGRRGAGRFGSARSGFSSNPSPRPSPAGSLTELQQVTAARPDVRDAFVHVLERDEPALFALLQPPTPEAPLLIRFKTGLAPHADGLRAVLASPQFKDNIKTGMQNAMAGAGPPRAPAASLCYII